MRIIFMGTPDFAVPSLRALHAAGHDMVAVYSQPPAPSGRGKKLQPSPVHRVADELGIPVLTPKSLRKAEAQAEFSALGADVAVVAAYGLILPQAVLDAPKHGCLNVHASLLPRWRGAAPIHRAVMAGDEATGVTIMQMEAGLDTGPMLAKVATPIDDNTTGELTAELAELGANLMVEVLAGLDRIVPVVQPENGVTYAAKIDKAEARIDWSRPASELVRHVHGLAPFPGAWCEVAPGSGSGAGAERLKLLKAEVVFESNDNPGTVLDDRLAIACAEAALRPLRLQRAGKPAMGLDEFLRGNPVAAGTVVQ
jgi:methionyl-tRNA formyltransferase